MSSDTSNQELLRAWRSGNHDAAALIFRRYQARLMALIRSRLSRKLARRVDAEDILLSAYRSFFVAVQEGRGGLGDADDLWPLLTTFALRKLARQARRHTAECRSIDDEIHVGSYSLETNICQEPTAEHAAILTDEIERLMNHLDQTAREVLVRTLQGQDVVMIANELQIHERTVRRAIERIRELLPLNESDLSVAAGFSSRIARKASIQQKPHSTSLGTVKYSDYLLKKFVGAGAFSKVYLAVKHSTGETVAVKYLRKVCWHDARAKAALIREYEILRQLNHPQILAIHGWGTTPGGAMFLVTDFIKGSNLAVWRRTARPSVTQILDIVRGVVAAVMSAHSENVIHGDLKPANVLVSDNGQITLCDFGLSRYVTDPEDVPRGGTAGFLAPEQISDAFGSVTPRTDVYGLGGLFYALLTGRPPMTGQDLPEVLANVLSQTPPEPPSRAGFILSEELESLILRCLQKEPQQRYASMQELSLVLASLT